jgi:hypothetical protein
MSSSPPAGDPPRPGRFAILFLGAKRERKNECEVLWQKKKKIAFEET